MRTHHSSRRKTTRNYQAGPHAKQVLSQLRARGHRRERLLVVEDVDGRMVPAEEEDVVALEEDEAAEVIGESGSRRVRMLWLSVDGMFHMVVSLRDNVQISRIVLINAERQIGDALRNFVTISAIIKWSFLSPFRLEATVEYQENSAKPSCSARMFQKASAP